VVKVSYPMLAVSAFGFVLPKFFIDEPKIAASSTFNLICFCLVLTVISKLFPEKR